MAKNIFVTGATGLIGSQITNRLLQEGYSVSVLVRDLLKIELLEPFKDQINLIEGDVLDVHTLQRAIGNHDWVIHCAAIVSFSPNRHTDMYQTNVEGTRNIVNVCLKLNTKIIFLSSIAAIGNYKGIPLNENEKWDETAQNTYYAKTKYWSEQEVWRGFEEGLDGIILNPSVVLGKESSNKSSSKLFNYVKNGGKFYSIGNLNFVDVRDIADIICMLMINPQINHKRFILNSGAVAYKDFFELIAKEYNVSAPRIKVTNLIASLAWRIEWLKHLFTGQEPLITKETAILSSKTRYFDNSKITNVLGFRFRTLKESIKWCCEKNA